MDTNTAAPVVTFATAKGHKLQDGEVFDYVDSRPAYMAEPVEVYAEALAGGRWSLTSTATGRLVIRTNPATKIGVVEGSRA